MEAYVVLGLGVVAGGLLVCFIHPQAAFRPVDRDVPPEAVGQTRWMFLGLFLIMLGNGMWLASKSAGTPADFRWASYAALHFAGIATMAWSLRGSHRLKRERDRLMRERHAAELAELEARQRR